MFRHKSSELKFWLPQLSFILVFALSLVSGGIAQAACTLPTAEAGARQYFTSDNKFKLCDGNTWIDFQTNGTMGACGVGGQIDFDTTDSVYKYCNATSWMKIQSPVCTMTSSSLVYQSKYHSAATIDYAVNVELSDDGTKAYVSTHYGAVIRVFDISSSPAAPTLIGSSAYIGDLVDSLGMDKRGNYLFVTARSSKALVVMDVSTTTPTYVNKAGGGNTMNNIWGLDISEDGNYLYAASYESGPGGDKCYLNAFNISNPASPTLVSAFNITDNGYNSRWCREVLVVGTTAYVGVGSAIVSINISNPAAMSYRHHISHANLQDPEGMALSADGTRLFVLARTPSTLNVINISNPASLSYVTGITNAGAFRDGYYIERLGNYAFVTSEYSDSFSVVNISNPAAPTIVQTLASEPDLNGANGFQIRGRYAYVAGYYGDTLAVVDIGCNPGQSGATLGTCSGGPAMQYFTSEKALGFCDGSNWQIMAQ